MNKFKHIIYGGQFNLEDLNKILEVSQYIEDNLEKKEIKRMLEGKIMASLFYEPSTRTRLSFETAAHKLGASVITVSDVATSSLKKGETLEDTLKTIEQYADFIVMRHSEDGAAQKASEILNIPFLNAGDGTGEHPTQALLDIYTIKKEQGKLSGLKIAIVGDLKYGRTVHSLAKILKHFDNEYYFVAPDSLQMPKKYSDGLSEKFKVNFSNNLQNIIDEVDVIYMTRVQKERFKDKTKYEKLKNIFTLSLENLKNSKENITIMHPLPRIGELHKSVDSHPGGACFRQVKNGIYVRMALIALSMGFFQN